MYNFIVLGIIPGTQYQTTFMFWVYVALGLIGSGLLVRVIRRRHAIRARLAARKIDTFIEQYEYSALQTTVS